MKQRPRVVGIGFLVQLGGLVLIHSVWLRPDYADTAGIWLPHATQVARAWAMVLAVFFYVVGAVFLYRPGPPERRLADGLGFGALLALACVVYGSLSSWVILPVPHMLVAKWIVGEGTLSLLFGVVVAALVRPARS